MTGKEMLKAYKEAGWTEIRVQGSHHVMEKDGQIEIIPVHGNKDLPTGLNNKLKKRIGLK